MADAEHVVDDLEALVFGGVVDGGNVRDLCILGRGVVLEKGEDGDDAGGGDADGQFVFPDRESALSDMALRARGTTHCWTYLGRHDIRYCPYLCRASPFSLYLSAGFTMAAVSLAMGSRGANCT